jgi:hypothetical protein
MSALAAPRGFSVRVFLPDGDPAGVKVIEKSNWTGAGLVIPRALFARAKARPELDRAGVYLLVGESERGPLPRVYLGEGDPVRPRLEQHGRAKDFWTHAVVFTSKDQGLNKAHVQRLEARLVELAHAAKRCVLDNGNVPQPPSLSEADTADVEGFLDDVLLCLPTLGYFFFERAAAESVAESIGLLLRARGVEAHGAETPQGFVVRVGSQAAKSETECGGPLRPPIGGAAEYHASRGGRRGKGVVLRQLVVIARIPQHSLPHQLRPDVAQIGVARGRTLKSIQNAAVAA